MVGSQQAVGGIGDVVKHIAIGAVGLKPHIRQEVLLDIVHGAPADCQIGRAGLHGGQNGSLGAGICGGSHVAHDDIRLGRVIGDLEVHLFGKSQAVDVGGLTVVHDIITGRTIAF